MRHACCCHSRRRCSRFRPTSSRGTCRLPANRTCDRRCGGRASRKSAHTPAGERVCDSLQLGGDNSTSPGIIFGSRREAACVAPLLIVAVDLLVIVTSLSFKIVTICRSNNTMSSAVRERRRLRLEGYTMPYGKGIPKFVPSFTYQPEHVLEKLVEKFEGKVIVDLGAGGRRVAPGVLTVDAVKLTNTDYVCDFLVEKTPFNDCTVDLVIATGILEHVENDQLFIAEIRRILKIGGTVHIELPFLQQYHEDPIDCRRLTVQGLELFLTQHDFQIVRSGVHIGPTVTILTLLSYYIDLVLSGKSRISKIIGNTAFVAFSLLAWPIRYLDRWLIKKPNSHRLAFGVYATATKK